MPLTPLVGHHQIRSRVAGAVATGSLPQVLLVTGAPGVGKERFGLWLGQLLLCHSPEAGEPCGHCAACLRVLGLVHPDLHWFFPIQRPKASEVEKQIKEAAESIETSLAERRADPLWLQPEGMASHGISTARLIQRRAAISSAEGGARVFLIGHAERLVPQEASQEAANALLKLLEEPPTRSWFILTATTPGQVLPTILSRSSPLRIGRNSDSEVREFFAALRPELATDKVVSRARGAIGSVIGSGSEATQARSEARTWLEEIARGVGAASERALRQGPWQARGDFTLLLDALAEHLSARAQAAIEHNSPAQAQSALAGIDSLQAAREQAQGNVNPQLILARLADQLTAVGAV